MDKIEDKNQIEFDFCNTGDGVYSQAVQMISKSSAQNTTTLSNSFGTDVIEPPIPIFDLAHLVLNSTWHSRCVGIKALSSTVGVASETPGVIEKLDKISLCKNHVNFLELERALATDLESLGNAYVEVVRDAGGKIVEIYHVPALTVRLRKGGGFWQMVTSRNIGETAFTSESLPQNTGENYILFGGGIFQKTFFKEFGDEQDYNIEGDPIVEAPIEDLANEIIHIKNYHPLSPLYGIPSFISSFTAMVCDEAAEKWNLSFFENNRVPRWLFTITGGRLKPEEKEDFKTYFTQMLKGRAHTPMFIALGNEGASINTEKLEADVNEASFIDLRDKNRDEILASHGVPPRLLGVITPGQLGGTGEGQIQREDFRDFAINPLQEKLEAWVNTYLLPGLGLEKERIELTKFDTGSAEQFEKKSNSVTKLVEKGVLSINEARLHLGLEPLQEVWADEHTINGDVGTVEDRLAENEDLKAAERDTKEALR